MMAIMLKDLCGLDPKYLNGLSITDYNTFILDIKREIINVVSRMQQNTIIMTRQQNNNDNIDEDVSYIETKQKKYDNLDTTLKLNLDIVNGYKSQTNTIVKIYPFIIILLILLLIYLSYLTVLKFIANIYDKY